MPQSSKREVSDHIWTPLSVVELMASVLKAQDHYVRLNVRKACACPFTIIELYLGAFDQLLFNPLHSSVGLQRRYSNSGSSHGAGGGVGGVMRATECILWHVRGGKV